MTTTVSAKSPQFEHAARQAISLVGSVSTRLQRMAGEADDPADRSDLFYLSSLAMLAGYRGAPFVGEDLDVDRSVDDTTDPVNQAVSAYQLLIEHTCGLDPFAVLDFVGDVGALCVELRLYGSRH